MLVVLIPAGVTTRDAVAAGDQATFLWHQGMDSPAVQLPFVSTGADARVGSPDDPATYVSGGPPETRANPFRGRFTPSDGERFHELDTETSLADPLRRAELLRQQAAGLLDHLDPRLFAIANDNSAVLNPAGIASRALVSDFWPSVENVARSANPLQIGRVFGGDWNPITPCQKPTTNPRRPAQEQIRGDLNFAFCIPDGQPVEPGNPAAGGTGSNIRMVGGFGELPMRPAPDRGNLDPTPNPPGAAQGLLFPFPPAATSFERNVDPITGRPRVAGATGACTAGFANPIAARRNSMTLAGVGTGPECLKGGGAAGYPNENRFRQAPDIDGDGRPDAALIKDLIGLGGALVVNGGFPDGTPDSVDRNGNGIPDDGDGMADFFGFGSVDPRPGSVGNLGLSPQAALESHPANQGLVAGLCSATLGFVDQLDPAACLFNLFATPVPILQAGGFHAFIFSEALSAFFSGEPDIGLARFMDLVVNTSIGLGPGGTQGTIPTRMLNRDRRLILDPTLLPPEFERRVGNFGDGVNTFTNVVSFNRTPTCLKPSNPPDPAGFVNPLASCIPDFAQDNIDWLSLDSSLTSEQRALLGCGPFFGTRCDSSARETDPLDSSIESFGFGGGLDLLNTEASAFAEAWFRDSGGGGAWTTTHKQLIQPGSVGRSAAGGFPSFDGAPVAARTVLGEKRVLPGARGLATPEDFEAAGLERDTPVFRLASDESNITAVFQRHYDPVVDGCPLGRSIAGIPVLGVDVETGAPVDLTHCGASADSQPGVMSIFSGTRFRKTQPGGMEVPANAERGGSNALVAANVAAVDDSQQVRRIDGSQTLFHPLAGCFPDPLGADEGVPCPVERDFEAEFLAGLRGTDGANDRVASVFRSEMAAASWNILQLLVVTSCERADGTVGSDEREAKPECFSPGPDPATGRLREWMSNRCGFAAPQLCRNVEFFLDLMAPDADFDGVWNSVDGCSMTADPDSRDSDLDGYGNACDADYDNDGAVGGDDFSILIAALGSSPAAANWTVHVDSDDDGAVAGRDFFFFLRRLGAPPGPSGLACAGTVPCQP